MTTVWEIYHFLDTKAPFALQEDWDNSGLLAGDASGEVQRVLVALDVTEQVIEEASALGAQLIVSHHPLIFRPVRQVTLSPEDLTGRKLWALARHGISAICCHTNLDAVEGGVNTALAQALGLTHITLLEQAGTAPDGTAYGIGRVGTLAQEMEVRDFLALVQRSLHPACLRYTPGGGTVRRVAVGGGACGDMLMQAYHAGCDAFVTSDLKYNHFLDAAELGMTLVDAGHFPTENVVVPVLVQWLRKAFPALEVCPSACHREVICAFPGENGTKSEA